uniref:Uncharacterized protein n=1 Tax=Siphoviridae sp. ct89S11 TaxID=2825357 RepID=A0A8S5URA6_9CAUD|nr:MAG TPA: hypothetical protein [Siphoviridae sp. ct89S11]
MLLAGARLRGFTGLCGRPSMAPCRLRRSWCPLMMTGRI